MFKSTYLSLLFRYNIEWENRDNKKIYWQNQKGHISVDCPESSADEPSPYNFACCSHNVYGPGLIYQIRISSERKDILVDGPFKCGRFNDIKMYKSNLAHITDFDEYVMADNWYLHPRCTSIQGQNLSKLSLHWTDEINILVTVCCYAWIVFMQWAISLLSHSRITILCSKLK